MKSTGLVLGLAAVLTTPAAAAVQPRAPAPAARPPQVAPAPAPVQTPPPVIPMRVSVTALNAVCNENAAACMTYVLGVVDGFVATTVSSFGRPYVCIPQQVSNQQLTNVAVAYLRAHPTQHQDAGIAVIRAVQASYPCAAPAPH
jgi:hypothetical protein